MLNVLLKTQRESEDSEAIINNLKQNEISELNDYLNNWTKIIIELLQKLKDTIPGDGMLGEVHYWRDLSRILDGISNEVK